MGLIVDVYRSARREGADCTMGGISSQFVSLCLVNVEGPFEPNDKAPAALLIDGALPGTLRILPAVPGMDGSYVRAPGWLMMGGNYAATSDSRFSDTCARMLGHTFYGAVPIHDRQE